MCVCEYIFLENKTKQRKKKSTVNKYILFNKKERERERERRNYEPRKKNERERKTARANE